MPSFFITGTDTGVGKTWFTCWLVRAWRAQGFQVAGIKPISTGDRHDAEQLREASGQVLALDEINPIHFCQPASPLIAARADNRSIDFTSLNGAIEKLAAEYEHLAVEGVGGWRVPLAQHYEVREWARALGFPVVVVARAGLGTLNHTLLTVDSVRQSGATCAGVVLNAGPEPSSPDLDLIRRGNLELLRDLLLLPIFYLDGRAHAAGEVPIWLGGKEI